MKTKQIIILVTILLIAFFGTIIPLVAGEAYNLNGEWTAVITKEMPNTPFSKTIETDIIKITQVGDWFVGIRTIGGKFIGKNEEIIKGKIVYKMIDDAFIHFVSDPTFELCWCKGKATITEEGNKIDMQTFVKCTGMYETVSLTR